MKEPFRIVILHFQLIQNLLSEVFKMLFRSKSSLFPGQQFENHSKATTQKGNAYLGLGQFDEATECFELLRSFGEGSTADSYLQKVSDAERKSQFKTQAPKNENEDVPKTVSHPNSRIEFKKSLPTYSIIAITTLAISIFLNWQFKN